jgi:hypothetical protein
MIGSCRPISRPTAARAVDPNTIQRGTTVVSTRDRLSLRIAVLMCTLPTVLLSLEAGVLRPGSDASIVTQTVTLQQVCDHLMAFAQWHPFPRVSERNRWTTLPPAVRAAYVREAEKLLHTDWPTPKATTFLEFVRTGDRSRYQAVS